jgi:hypothetical protein
MRLTPSQIGMLHLLGKSLPFCEPPGWTLKERVRAGHAFLVETTGQDFGFDPSRWHDYLRETNAGGYRWSNKHLGMPKQIAEVNDDPAWCRAIEELRNHPRREGGGLPDIG